MAATYTRVPAAEVPSNLRWDVPGRLAGQIVETAYATPGARYEQDDGATYKRVTDRTGGEGTVRFFRLAADTTPAVRAYQENDYVRVNIPTVDHECSYGRVASDGWRTERDGMVLVVLSQAVGAVKQWIPRGKIELVTE